MSRRWDGRSGAKAAWSRAQEERAVERLIHGRCNGVTAAKVRTVEEQAGVREIHLMAVWRKGGKDEREGGSDNGEIL